VFVTRLDAKRNRHPLLIATGDEDDVVPPAHGKLLSDSAARFGVSTHLEVKGANHATRR
jgi:pimeloyl-ACP methyl ester carboxylesterase